MKSNSIDGLDFTSFKTGAHTAIFGKTGSGKTQLLIKIAVSSNQPIIIFDTKNDRDFDNIAVKGEKFYKVKNFREFLSVLKIADFDYLVITPQDFELNNYKALDNYLIAIYNHCKNVKVLLDETYQFHNFGRCGNGLNTILTRGRSKKISLCCCTQRPKWISQFIFSESTYFFILDINGADDKAVIAKYLPFDKETNFNDLPQYGFFFFDTSAKKSDISFINPISVIEKKQKTKHVNFF